MTDNPTTGTKKLARRQPPQLLEWVYTVGPSRRPWQWYGIVLVIGLGLGALFYITLGGEWSAAFGMLIWTCIVVAASLAPARGYQVQLDGQVLYVWDVKRSRAIVERNLAEFATYKLVVLSADRARDAHGQLGERDHAARHRGAGGTRHRFPTADSVAPGKVQDTRHATEA